MACCGKAGLASFPPEPNFLFDVSADFCDRHETAFKLGERCPKCLAANDAVPNHKGENDG
jgi:hypothetical protein